MNPEFRGESKAAFLRVCPSCQEWMDYAAGKLGAATRESMERHAATCESCRELMADASDFLTPARPDERGVDTEAALAAVWAKAAPRPIGNPGHRRPAVWIAAGLAAALAVVFAGTAWRYSEELAGVRQELADARRELNLWDAPNPEVLTLFPEGSALRSGHGEAAASATPAGRLTLVSLGELKAPGPFTVELRINGQLVKRWTGVGRTAAGDARFTLLNPPAGAGEFLVTPGPVSYRVQFQRY